MTSQLKCQFDELVKEANANIRNPDSSMESKWNSWETVSETMKIYAKTLEQQLTQEFDESDESDELEEPEPIVEPSTELIECAERMMENLRAQAKCMIPGSQLAQKINDTENEYVLWKERQMIKQLNA